MTETTAAPKQEVQVLGGKKFDDNKPRFDLLPFDALRGVAGVLHYGANKYADRNWEQGMRWGCLVAAGLRHVGSWMTGYDYDEESKLHHLAHAGCCFLMLYALVLRKIGADDRGHTDSQIANRTHVPEAK